MIFHTVLNNKKRIKSHWLQEDIINLGDPSFVIPDSYQYEILEVTDKYVARPDLLSFDIYGDVLFSDLLCKLNGISNPFELNNGMILLIPNLSNLTFFYKRKSASSVFESDDVPISSTKRNFQKTKNERRRPSEQTIGSKNFIVDLSNKMIIY